MAKGTPNGGMNGTLIDGLIGHWGFTNGSLNDKSGNGKNLIVGTSSNFATDKDNLENNCMGANSYLGLNERLILNSNNSPFSFTIWFKKTTIDGTLIGNGNYMNGGCYVQLQNGNLQLIADSTIISLCSLSAIGTGWHLLSVKYDGTIIKAKIDNVQVASQNVSIKTPSDSYKNFAIGCNYSRSSSPYLSRFDEVRVYNRYLKDNEEHEIFKMGVNYRNNGVYKISEIDFNIDFTKVQLGEFIEVKYLDIRANGVSISNENPIVKYWDNYEKIVEVFNKKGEIFENSLDLYFQIECSGYQTSDIIHKELKMIDINNYSGDYNGAYNNVTYLYHNNDNYKKSEARILIPLTNTSFISYKK